MDGNECTPMVFCNTHAAPLKLKSNGYGMDVWVLSGGWLSSTCVFEHPLVQELILTLYALSPHQSYEVVGPSIPFQRKKMRFRGVDILPSKLTWCDG